MFLYRIESVLVLIFNFGLYNDIVFDVYKVFSLRIVLWECLNLFIVCFNFIVMVLFLVIFGMLILLVKIMEKVLICWLNFVRIMVLLLLGLENVDFLLFFLYGFIKNILIGVLLNFKIKFVLYINFIVLFVVVLNLNIFFLFNLWWFEFLNSLIFFNCFL